MLIAKAHGHRPHLHFLPNVNFHQNLCILRFSMSVFKNPLTVHLSRESESLSPTDYYSRGGDAR